MAQNRFGRKIKVDGTGLLSRALQHELDHLDGKLYIDYLDSMDELIPVGQGGDDEQSPRRSPKRSERSPDVPAAKPPRTIFLGSGGFGVPTLRRLAASPDVAPRRGRHGAAPAQRTRPAG